MKISLLEAVLSVDRNVKANKFLCKTDMTGLPVFHKQEP